MTETYRHILFEVKDGVATLTLNRPPVNVLNIEMMREINTVLEELHTQKDVKLVVLQGEGKAFSAGVDVKDHTGEKVEEMMTVFHGMFRLLNSLESPTLAVVHGAALGGGCELATFCDMVLASEEATFGQPEIKVGVFPPIAAIIFPHIIRRNRALELVLTGDVVSAQEAEKIGLINAVFPREHFHEKVEAFIAKLKSLSGPVLKLTKKAVDVSLYRSVDDAISKVESVYLHELMSLEDAHEGIKAFLEKREPVWKDG